MHKVCLLLNPCAMDIAFLVEHYALVRTTLSPLEQIHPSISVSRQKTESSKVALLNSDALAHAAATF